MQGRYFAEQAVKLFQVPAFRAEHFPYAGPYPWLDRPDALERVDEKLQRGELTEHRLEPAGVDDPSRKLRRHLFEIFQAALNLDDVCCR